MKSSRTELKKRGYLESDCKDMIQDLSDELLREMLQEKEAEKRSAAAVGLVATNQENTAALLQQLVVEKCLYTRIAICESLEKGNIDTARAMTSYLGCIGNNQHKILPANVSKKKSYPLPRDLIARSLGKMKPEILPVLFEILEGEEKSCDTKQVALQTIRRKREVVDAIGYLIFYNEQLATAENEQRILRCLEREKEDDLIVWKIMTCLSAFHGKQSHQKLLEYSNYTGTIGLEAQRSLHLRKAELKK